jgi:hypothetical protein
MGHYAPPTTELIAAVTEFLADLEPKLDAGDRYHSIVCRHLLAMVRRELECGPPQTIDEATLIRSIRAGECDQDMQLPELLLSLTIERVAQVKPDHLAPEHRPRD